MAAARIALDAFGGDHCPGPEVEGALLATRAGVAVTLVGDQTKLEVELRRHAGGGEPPRIHHASEVIEMDDSPSRAVRGKPDASMPVCFDLVRKGEADVAISAGNSGAMLACGLLKYRRIKGVDRPAIVTSLPTRKGWVCLLDVGANVECRPINFVQFAIMGAVYSRFKHGAARPRVGVLSNGTEEGKGTELTRAVHRLLSEHRGEDFEYAGYVEGGDVFAGDVDVVVTDGFTGNVALKIAEATGRLIGGWIKDAVARSTMGKVGALMMRGAFSDLRRMLDPDTYGAAPLLGVDGLAFVCHGGASAYAIDRAIELAARSVDEDLMPQLASALERHATLVVAAKEEKSR